MPELLAGGVERAVAAGLDAVLEAEVLVDELAAGGFAGVGVCFDDGAAVEFDDAEVLAEASAGGFLLRLFLVVALAEVLAVVFALASGEAGGVEAAASAAAFFLRDFLVEVASLDAVVDPGAVSAVAAASALAFFFRVFFDGVVEVESVVAVVEAEASA
jgi:hypothetical protein